MFVFIKLLVYEVKIKNNITSLHWVKNIGIEEYF